MIIDALRRAPAKKILAVIPYLAYCRQDRRTSPGAPITAKLIADMLTVAGIDELMTIDLHTEQVEGFFDVPVTTLHAQEVFLRSLKDHRHNDFTDHCIIVAPDVGGLQMAERYAKSLKMDLVLMKKERTNAFDVQVELVGKVEGKNVLIVDDICSTAGTLVAAAELCHRSGAKQIRAMITHGIFVKGALEKIDASPLDSLSITDTLPQGPEVLRSTKINIVSVAPLLAEAIRF